MSSYSLQEKSHLNSSIRDIEESGASYEKPRKIGQYSLTVNKETGVRQISFDDQHLSYLHLPSSRHYFSFDLTEGYDRYRHIDWAGVVNSKLDEFLQWIVENRALFGENPSKPLDVDFVTYRGVLTKLMVTPFVRDKWLLGACKFKGTIYLCPYYETEERGAQNNLFSYGGHRFEHYITSHHPSQLLSNTFSSVIGEFSLVFKSKLQSASGKLSLMYAAEVDCLDQGKSCTDDTENFVEIKTTRKMFNNNHERNFKQFKLIKWWAQSYLIGISKIICGYKDNSHRVDEIETLDVHQIPKRCSTYWTRRQCFNFLHQFLTFVQQIVGNEDDPNKVYLFTNNEQMDRITCKQLLHSEQFNILPDWYIQSWKCENFNKK